MNYTTKLYTTKSASVLVPLFFPEDKKPDEIENSRRMNDFYDEMKRSVFNYTESDSFPDQGRYFAKATVDEKDGLISVNVIMRLRRDGKTQSTKSMTHIWRNGVVEKRVYK